MKFKTSGVMKSKPDFKVDAAIEPVAINASMQGKFEGNISSISAHVDEVPIRLAIPFMKPRKKLTMVASIGDFNVTLHPFSLKVDGTAITLDGMLGTKGIRGSMACDVDCETTMDVEGKLMGKVGTFSVELDDEDID